MIVTTKKSLYRYFSICANVFKSLDNIIFVDFLKNKYFNAQHKFAFFKRIYILN